VAGEFVAALNRSVGDREFGRGHRAFAGAIQRGQGPAVAAVVVAGEVAGGWLVVVCRGSFVRAGLRLRTVDLRPAALLPGGLR
jgi:hypothetical protein